MLTTGARRCLTWVEAHLVEAVDELLIERTLTGSLECFDVLMQRYQRDVYGVAWSYTSSREDALDLSQEVFLKVYRKLGTFGGRSSFRTWLLAIANREGLNWIRTSKRRAPAAVVAVDDEVLPAPSDQEADLLHEERRRVVQRSLGSLNQRSRLAVILRYFREMPIRDIAAVLECSEAVVRNMLFRSVRRLRDAVAAE